MPTAVHAALCARESVVDLLAELLEGCPGSFSVRLWDASHWRPAGRGQTADDFTIVLNHPGSLRRMFAGWNEVAFGAAYVYGDFDVEGDMEAFARLVWHLADRSWSWSTRMRLGRRLLALPSTRPSGNGRPAARLRGTRHSPERDRQAIAYHYDLSNDFYALWLDARMVYSCAYFAEATDSLDVAQRRKLDYICRKLRLRPGERLLDIGCGWGGLVLHAAEHFGAEAVGITLSRAQAELASRRVSSAGLEDRCRICVCDYREIEKSECYDKLVSVGMCEHVGRRQLQTYFAQAWQRLRPGGMFLNHGIARPASEPSPTAPTFVTRYVFPDGELQTISELLPFAEAAGFEIRDVESLREHYALTLGHWLRRLEDHRQQAREVAGEMAFRVWRLFMSMSCEGFRTGRLNIYQALLVKPRDGRSGLPLTRADWYA